MMFQLVEVHLQLNLLAYNWISVLHWESWYYWLNIMTVRVQHMLLKSRPCSCCCKQLTDWHVFRAQILCHCCTKYRISLLMLDIIGWRRFRVGCWLRYFSPVEESRWIANEHDKNIPHLFGKRILRKIPDPLRTGENTCKIRSFWAWSV